MCPQYSAVCRSMGTGRSPEDHGSDPSPAIFSRPQFPPCKMEIIIVLANRITATETRRV